MAIREGDILVQIHMIGAEEEISRAATDIHPLFVAAKAMSWDSDSRSEGEGEVDCRETRSVPQVAVASLVAQAKEIVTGRGLTFHASYPSIANLSVMREEPTGVA